MRAVVVSVGAVFLVSSVGRLFFTGSLRFLFVVLGFHCGESALVSMLRSALRVRVGLGELGSLIGRWAGVVGRLFLLCFGAGGLVWGPL